MTMMEDIEDQRVVPQVTAKFLTKTFVLKGLLDKSMTVLPTNDIGQGQILRNFQIELIAFHEDEPQLRIAATDMALWTIASTVLVTVESEGDAKLVLPGKMLNDVVVAAEEGDMEFDVSEGLARISVGRTTWELSLPDGSKYPPFPDTEGITFHEIPRGPFVDAIAKVRYAASNEAQRLNLLMIDIRSPAAKNKPGRVRATDAVRYHQVSLTGWPKGFDLQIPTKAVDVLVSLLRTTEVEKLEIGETDDHIVFRLAEDTFVASKLSASFPNVDDRLVAPALDNDQELVVDRRALLSAIRRVRITSDPETSAVALVLSKGKLVVRSKTTSKLRADACSEELDVVWSGSKRTVGFNHKHLSEMLASIDSPSCTFLLGEDTKQRRSPLLLRDEASGTISVLSQQRPDFVS